MHIRKFLSGIFEKVENSLLLLGIDSRHYACIRDGYLALNERAQPFSKIPLILAYGLQDATVLSKGSPLGEEVEFTAFFAFMQIKSEKLYLIRIRAA